jgi:hypothetical protein
MSDIYICVGCGREEAGDGLRIGFDPRYASGKCYVCKGKNRKTYIRKDHHEKQEADRRALGG